MYSEELVSKVKEFFMTDDWNYSFDKEDGIFKAGVNLQGKLRQCKVTVVVREKTLSAYATIDIKSDLESRGAISEFVTRANYGMILGNFEMDYSDGEISYKCSLDCSDGMVPSLEVIERMITIPAIMFEKYGDALLSVLFGFSTPEDAIDKVENS